MAIDLIFLMVDAPSVVHMIKSEANYNVWVFIRKIMQLRMMIGLWKLLDLVS